MAFPHHPAALWGLVSAATDWDFHDPEIQRLVEIFSRHANFEDFESTSVYTKNIGKLEGHSVQDAWQGNTASGLRPEVIHIRWSMASKAVSLPCSPGSLQGKASMTPCMTDFTCATTGARILASLKIGTAHMGQEISVHADEPVLLDVSVLGTREKGRVQLIKNNQVLSERETGDGCCDFSFRDAQWRQDDCYYVRVVQEDGHMAWTSPIWVDEAL